MKLNVKKWTFTAYADNTGHQSAHAHSFIRTFNATLHLALWVNQDLHCNFTLSTLGKSGLSLQLYT